MKIPKTLQSSVEEALEEGAKIFYFENFDDEEALFVEYKTGDVTIYSWPRSQFIDVEEVSTLNISAETRNKLAKDLTHETSIY